MGINKVEYGDRTIMDITDTTAEAADVALGKEFYGNDGVKRSGTGNYMDKASNPTADDILVTDASGQAVDSGVDINDVVLVTDVATGQAYGLVKLNPNENIDINANGQLTVGGRLGQTADGGLYNPVSINPEYVGAFSLLMSDATGLYLGSTSFACAKGNGLTLKNSHAAGSTVYRATNSYSNRFIAAAMKGGYAALNNTTAATKTVKVVSVKFANGDDISVYSGPTENDNDIIVTLSESVNPDSATTQIRGYGDMQAQAIYVGQLVGNGGNGGNGQKCIVLGQGISSCANNSICVGNGIYNTQRAFLFGASLINTKLNAFMAGANHDSRSGKNGVAAVGIASDIGETTAFAVGNGTNENNRSNIFEVRNNSRQTEVIMKSPNGTKYKLAVDDSGNLTTSPV